MRREFYGENKGENNTRNRAVYEEKPNIPKEKFTQYALNSSVAPDKANAFREALGHTQENYEQLIEQIEQTFKVDKCSKKVTMDLVLVMSK